MTPTLMILWKLDYRSRNQKQKRKNQPITMPGLFFGFRLRHRQSSFHWIINIGVISGIPRKYNPGGSGWLYCFQIIFRDRIITASVTSHSNQPGTAQTLARVRQDASEVKKREIKNHGWYCYYSLIDGKCANFVVDIVRLHKLFINLNSRLSVLWMNLQRDS